MYAKKELSDATNQLKQLTNLSMFFVENLHAKFYFNEKESLS